MSGTIRASHSAPVADDARGGRGRTRSRRVASELARDQARRDRNRRLHAVRTALARARKLHGGRG